MKILKKFLSKEILSYLICGVLTTLVNFVSYYIFCNILNIQNLIANIIAWIIAVAFAYIVNNIFVFETKTNILKEEFKKISKFVSARLCTFFVEEIFMFIFVDLLLFNNLIVKVFVCILIIILNYVFSKLFIFRRM